ncbi:hypothetical protein EDD85DRAFT_948110 [Armillaria nabsnona]|nr:hypothetical protein EDD85DRAFT_948110 [Armillaria nabsnona]
MDHHKEEHTDLLPPSGPNNDPFPAVAPWSEAGHSSSSATLVEPLPTARRIRLGGTLGVIACLLFGAALTAVLHHVYLFIPATLVVVRECAPHVPSPYITSLWPCSKSRRSSLVHAPGDEEVDIRVNTDLFAHRCTLVLEVKEKLPTDVRFESCFPNRFQNKPMSMNTLQYTSQMYGFVAMYKSVCRPSLKLFIFYADDNVIAIHDYFQAYEPVLRQSSCNLVQLVDVKVKEVQGKAVVQVTVDIDNLEASKTPESISLGAMSHDQTKDRTDRALVTPWLKSLVRREMLEMKYKKIPLKSCLQHQRKVDFCRLAGRFDLIFQMLRNIHTSCIQSIFLTQIPYSITWMHNSLCSTIELELWQEAFAEDIRNLLTMVKKAPRPAMMANFYEKLTKTSSSDLAGQVLVSGLAVPMDRHTEEQDEVKGMPNWLTALLSLANMLTQAGCSKTQYATPISISLNAIRRGDLVQPWICFSYLPDSRRLGIQSPGLRKVLKYESPPSSSSSTSPPLVSSPVLNIPLAVPRSVCSVVERVGFDGLGPVTIWHVPRRAGGFIDRLSDDDELAVDDERNPDYICIHTLVTGYFIGGGLNNLLGGTTGCGLSRPCSNGSGICCSSRFVGRFGYRIGLRRAPVVMLPYGRSEGELLGIELSRDALEQMLPRLVGIEDVFGVGMILAAGLRIL